MTVPARPPTVLMRSLPNCGSGSVMGCGEATAAVLATGGELAGLARAAACDAQRLLINVKQAIRRGKVKAAQLAARGQRDAAACRPRGRLVPAVNELQKLVALTHQIVTQTHQRVAEQTPAGADRRVSLHESGARPNAEVRLGKPVEFGHNGQSPTTASCSTTPSRSATFPTHRHRRPRLLRETRRRRPARPGCAPRRDTPQWQTIPGPARRRTPARPPAKDDFAQRI